MSFGLKFVQFLRVPSDFGDKFCSIWLPALFYFLLNLSARIVCFVFRFVSFESNSHSHFYDCWLLMLTVDYMGRYYRDMNKSKEKNTKFIGSNSTRYDSFSFNLLIGAKKLPPHISPYIIYTIRNCFLFFFPISSLFLRVARSLQNISVHAFKFNHDWK